MNSERTKNAMKPLHNAISEEAKGMNLTNTPMVPNATMAVMICIRATIGVRFVCSAIGQRIYGFRKTRKSNSSIFLRCPTYPFHCLYAFFILPCTERVYMNKEKTIATYSALLSDIATEISQTCSTRNSVLNIYMGSSLPQLQLDLFKPILLENYAYLCSCLQDEEISKALHLDMEDIATSVELEPSVFQQARIQEYARAEDPTSLYSNFCIFIILNRANASTGKGLNEDDLDKLSSNTLLTLQLGAQRMREAAEAN